MVKRIILYITFLLVGGALKAQVSSGAQQYNTFTSRNFMKFNRFLTVPTFSALPENKTSLTAIVRNSNIAFEDNPRLYVATYSGEMRENVGAGFALYQQEVGVFKDFGAIANYAQRLNLDGNMALTFGFNFLYSRRSANALKENSTIPDPGIANFQDIPLVMLQPAVTLSFGKIGVGIFFENIVDFNLKSSEMVTSFSDKTFSAHGMYSYDFDYSSGFFEGASLRALVIARKAGQDGFGGAGSLILDLPKAVWLKAGYDSVYGMSAGLGVNVSDRLAIGISYETNDFSSTNEVGLIYNFGQKSYRRRRAKRRGKVNFTLPKRGIKKKVVTKDKKTAEVPEKLIMSQNSIKDLKKEVDDLERLMKDEPEKEIVANEVEQEQEEKDTSLKRRSKAPWREKTITRSGGGGGGTMYYVVSDKYKNKENVNALIEKWSRLNIEAKYIYSPSDKLYYVYIDRYAKESDAEDKVFDFNDKTRKFENNDKNDKSSIKIKKGGKDPVYVVKLTIGTAKGSYKELKKQPPARVRTVQMKGIAPGYYLQVYVNSKKSLADRNVDELKNDDIAADYFVNPVTGNYHIYIAKTNNENEIIRLYNSNLDGAFYNAKTIIHIK